MRVKIGRNIFTTFLDLLHVKYTKSYSEKFYNEHPHKQDLYGLSKMLSIYNIDNVAVRIKEDKESALSILKTPFVAYVGNDFCIVHYISERNVHYIGNDQEVSITKEQFTQSWSGIVLVAEPSEKSIEPDYKKHYQEEQERNGKIILLVIAVLLMGGILVYISNIYDNLILSIVLLINLAGGWVSYLLLLKQMHIHSDYADKICSLFRHQNDCNDVLKLDTVKLFGLLSWSEIGLSYFFTNILMILCLPTYYSYVALINICTLPYTIWSLWYQKVVAKQWCILCLTVQVILWLLFIMNIVFDLITWPIFTWISILQIGCIYLIPVLLLNILISNLTDSKKIEQITQEFNSLKANENIFRILLKTNRKYNFNNIASSITWGNSSAKNRITIITNLHCNPCAKMHKRLEQLLRKTNNGYSLQYILTSFNKDSEDSNKLFIAAYKEKDETQFCSFLNEWYTEGKNNRQKFYQKYPFNREDEMVLSELQEHKKWIQNAKITMTPTLLFNGYELPRMYKVEDLEYFIQTDI